MAEYGKERSVSTKDGWFFDQLSDYQKISEEGQLCSVEWIDNML
jgi:hypothetical protein